MTDRVVPRLSVRNATAIINYEFPPKKTDFGRRLACLLGAMKDKVVTPLAQQQNHLICNWLGCFPGGNIISVFIYTFKTVIFLCFFPGFSKLSNSPRDFILQFGRRLYQNNEIKAWFGRDCIFSTTVCFTDGSATALSSSILFVLMLLFSYPFILFCFFRTKTQKKSCRWFCLLRSVKMSHHLLSNY